MFCKLHTPDSLCLTAEAGPLQRNKMKISQKLYLTLATGFTLATTNALQAGSINLLNVDFEIPTSATQSGFQTMTNTPTTFATPLGPVTVTVTGNDAFYDRGGGSPPNAGAFTYSDLYRDFVYANGGAFTVALSGLATNKDYELRLYAFDYNDDPGPNTTTFTPVSGTL